MKIISVLVMVVYIGIGVSAQLPQDDSCIDTPLELRGDVNNDQTIGLADAIYLLNYLFKGGEVPKCSENSDVNNDGKLDITDAIFILRYLFTGGEAPIEIDKEPLLAMPAEVSLNLDTPLVFDSWYTKNFQGDVVSCSSIATPLSKEGEPVTLFAFERESDNPIMAFSESFRNIFDPAQTPSGKYEVRTRCKDIKGHEGVTLTDLTITTSTDTDGDGEIDPEFDPKCVNDAEAGKPEEERQRFDICCENEEGINACIKPNQNTPNGIPDCERDIPLAGVWGRVDVEKCNEEQGGGATYEPPKPPEAYCKVKCVAIFYGQGVAKCKTEEVVLSNILPNLGDDNQPGLGYKDPEKAWDSKQPGVGGNHGDYEELIKQVIDENGKSKLITVNKERIGNGFIVYAEYIGVDKNGDEIGEGAGNVDGKLCREYQSYQENLVFNFGARLGKHEYYPTKSIGNKLRAFLTGMDSSSLYKMWEEGPKGFLKPLSFITVFKEGDKESGVPGMNKKDQECKFDGPNFCADDYHQLKYDSEYKKEREWPITEVVDGKDQRFLGKKYIQTIKSFMMYQDNPYISNDKLVSELDLKANFLITVENQDIAGVVKGKVDCILSGHGFALVLNDQKKLVPQYKTPKYECTEWEKDGAKWKKISKWTG